MRKITLSDIEKGRETGNTGMVFIEARCIGYNAIDKEVCCIISGNATMVSTERVYVKDDD